MLHVAKRVDAKIMWLNLHLLFWLSLIPVSTGWVGDHPNDSVPAALYVAVAAMWFVPDRQIAQVATNHHQGT
jgi:uncharacterized membrane protein